MATTVKKDPANDDSYEAQSLWDWFIVLAAAIGGVTAFLTAFIYSL